MCIKIINNTVGMAVTMVISTLHEIICIDLHIAWKFEIKFRNFIHTCRNYNIEIVEVP